MKNDVTRLSTEHAVHEAAERRMFIRVPKDHELFLDIDDKAQFATFEAQLEMIRSFGVDPIVKEKTPSRGGADHWHVVLEMPFTMTPVTRVLWQALLGSDLRREMLSALALHYGQSTQPTMFFESSTETSPAHVYSEPSY